VLQMIHVFWDVTPCLWASGFKRHPFPSERQRRFGSTHQMTIGQTGRSPRIWCE